MLIVQLKQFSFAEFNCFVYLLTSLSLTRQPRVRPVRRKPSLVIYRVHAPRRAESAS